MDNLAKAAAVGALALNGATGGDGNSAPLNNEPLPACPRRPDLAKYHLDEVCMTKPTYPRMGAHERRDVYTRLMNSGMGATLVPNEETRTCPLEVQSLESSSAVKGFDTTWIVENTASTPVVLAWVVNGVEWSPFTPDMKPQDDPKAILQPGDWTSVPTFQSFVYHVRELAENGPGPILLQHRAGMIPLGNPQNVQCAAAAPDVEPVEPKTGVTNKEFGRQGTDPNRRCNTIDVGFRNQVGCPLHVYWANQQIPEEVATNGFNCGEHFQFHLGTKPAPQDFFEGWNSATKFEGTYMGHTFVARLANDPSVVVDSYTMKPTRVIDCPASNKQQVQVSESAQEAVAAALVEPQGHVQQLEGLEGEAGPQQRNTAAAGVVEGGAAAAAAAATGTASLAAAAGAGGMSG